jgi:hemerythrin-like domain-containing protein
MIANDSNTGIDLDIDHRAGWPDDLRLFLDRFPRAGWTSHANLGGHMRLLLDIHGGFRRFGNTLQAATLQFREGTVTADHFRSWFAPRLNMFLSHLNGHHQIEDHQFFPTLAAAEPRLARGFDTLEKDHEVIHATMDRLVETANRFLQTPEGDGDKLRFAGDAYADTTGRLLILLDRHLDDEEDLIIPLALARGEADLGL